SANLEDATLLLEYPEGTRVAGDLATELSRHRESLGGIGAQSEARKTVKAVLFGEKDTVKTIKVILEYRVEGSSATFEKEKLYDIVIRSAPIIFTPTYPLEIDSRQFFVLVLDVSSNTV